MAKEEEKAKRMPSINTTNDMLNRPRKTGK
jgi:hypothetical protein